MKAPAGYRDIFALATLIETGMQFEIPDDIDPFGASLRSAATLYKYWAFLTLSEVVGDVCGAPELVLSLFAPSPDGLALDLRQGQEAKLSWKIKRLGRTLSVEI